MYSDQFGEFVCKHSGLKGQQSFAFVTVIMPYLRYFSLKGLQISSPAKMSQQLTVLPPTEHLSLEISHKNHKNLGLCCMLLWLSCLLPWSAVVMRAWHAFLSSVNFPFIVNFLRAFSLSLIYLLSFFFLFFFLFHFFSFYLFTNSLFFLALVPTYLLCLNIIQLYSARLAFQLF